MDAFITQMVTALLDFFGGNAYLTVFVVSLIPMVEIRGAIPIAIELGLNPVVAYFMTAIGSALVICPLVMLCLKPVLNAFKKTKLFKKIALVIEENFKLKAADIEQKATEKSDKSAELTEQDAKKADAKRTFYKSLGLFLFIAVPLPMAGLWTGSAIAAFIDLKFRYSIPSIILGNFVGAILIMSATLLLGEKSYILLIVLAVFIIIAVSGALLTIFIKNRRAKKASPTLEGKQEDGE